MMQNRIFACISGAVILSFVGALQVGCSADSARDALGIGKQSPDEYLIVERAPLSVPPDYELRPPSASDLEAQYADLRERAEKILLGSGDDIDGPISESEEAFLSDAGALNADAAIRRLIDVESGVRVVEDDRLIDDLMFWGEQEGRDFIVDPVAEAERLRRNFLSGMPVTYGASPTIEQKN
jgi:hypothetical protein